MQDTLDPNDREYEKRAIEDLRQAAALAKQTAQEYEQFLAHFHVFDRQAKKTGVIPAELPEAKRLVMESWERHENANRALRRAQNRLSIIQGRSEAAVPVQTKPPTEAQPDEPFEVTEAMRFAKWLVETGRLHDRDDSADTPVIPTPPPAIVVEPELTMAQKREQFGRWLVEKGKISEGEG